MTHTNLLLASFMIVNLPSYTAIRSDVVGSLTRVLYCGNLFSIVARNYKNKKKKTKKKKTQLVLVFLGVLISPL